MLHCVISLLQIHKRHKQRPPLQDGSVNEVPQGKQMVDRRMPRAEASLRRAAKTVLLRPGN